MRFLSAEAVQYTVIGGCAVGAYAHLRGLDVFSGDLDVTGDRTLSEPLAARLLPLARLETDFRFLAGYAPTRALAAALIQRAPAAMKDALREIVARRRLQR